MKRFVLALVFAILSVVPSSAGVEEDAVRHLLHTTFDRPDTRLVIDPVIVVRDNAVAGWSRGDNGGRALLRRKNETWSLVLCAGDAIRAPDDAETLAARLADAESRLPAVRLALLAKFDGIMTMQSGGEHPAVQHVQHQMPMGDMPMHHQMQQPPAQNDDAAVQFKAGGIVVSDPWIRATPAGAKVAGGYMRITNTDSVPDRLVGGTLEGAGGFEVHEMSMDGDVMRMRPLTNGLEIKPGETVELKTGSYHIMGTRLQRSFNAGDRVKGTLRFEKAGTTDIEYVVRPIGGSR